MQGIDSLVFPSLYEGLPVTIVEAQASGLPCVLSKTISKETEITSLISWLDLNDSVKTWSDTLIKLSTKYFNNRQSPTQEIRDSGYDIDDTSKWIQEFYIEKSK